ncbi:Uncharacterized protein slr1919 [Durusdinium trenchii]|uniref:Uncharacterized protein slr1919 n=1 Tax=Durusdinium trenchii TaxID=1381693 RepID=A0ABP0S834_9DINO
MAFKEGWLLKRGSSDDWLPHWCVLDQQGFRYYTDSARLHELGEVALGPGSRASRFSSLRAPGDSAKYRKEKPWGFALEVNLAAKHRPVEYFEAEDAKSLGDWLSAIEGWVEDSMWHPGDIVLVREDFVSDSEQQMPLKMGSFGMVVEVDADGDTKVDFPCHDARQWVFERNQHKLHLEKDLEPKEVFLEIVPQNDVIMHWALRVGRGRISRCYEFEADGVSQSWHTFLDKGYEITKQKLGTTSRLHREIFAWCRTFGLENSYDAAGNGLLGGKNCQDFVLELCTFLRIDTEQLPYRQAEKVKTVLGAGALVAADAALGTGLLAGAMDAAVGAGAAVGAAVGSAVAGPTLVACAAVVTVVAGTGEVSIGLEEELKRLRAQEADDQAALQKMRAEEARELQQIHWKSEVAQEELRAFEACGAQLKSISLEMAEEAKSLEGELQRESLKIRRLREVLPGPTLLRRASSAPQLSWREVYEQHGEVPEARPVGAIRRCRKAQAGPQAPAQPFVALPTPLVKISVARKDSRLVADIDDGLRRQILRYVANILSNDYDAIPADLVAMGFIAPRGLMAMEEKQVARSISDVFQSLAAGGTAQQRIADVLPALAEIKQQHGSIGQIPAPFVYILRCFSILEGHGLRLDRNYRIVEDCYPYLANWALRAKASEAPLIRSVLYGPRVQGAVAVPDVNQVLRLLRGLPRLQDLQEASEGGADLKLKSGESDRPTGRGAPDIAEEANTGQLA